MILHSIIAVLATALVLYTLFGGADYGAGILTLCPWGKDRDAVNALISRTIGPVWEANHVWLILIVVILFVGFPDAYVAIARHLHWPIVAVLFGIIVRGCAFVFMHYDPIKDHTQKWYQAGFALGSAWTSLWLGIVLGGLSSGDFRNHGTTYEVFFAGWMTLYSVVLGLFISAIFATLASIYLLGESQDRRLQAVIKRKTKVFAGATVILGAMVFLTSALTSGGMVWQFFQHPISIASFVGASVLLIPLYLAVKNSRVIAARLLCAAVTACVILGWTSTGFPKILDRLDTPITFYAAAAGTNTLQQLLVALVVGIALIAPSLLVLYSTFKSGSMLGADGVRDK